MKIARFLSEQNTVHLGVANSDGSFEILEEKSFGDWKKTGRQARSRAFLPPVLPSAIICIGLNYREHAKETGMRLPDYPVVFMKNPACVIGHKESIVLPESCREPLQVDYEVELAVVIGKSAKNVRKDDALNYVAGYTIANDVSARTWQMKAGGHQWVRGKSFDTFCPLGPFMVTPDELSDPDHLALRCSLNGEIMQQGDTSDMIFPVGALIEYLSTDTTLLPGTLILTGTPSGVGFMRSPPLFLKPGDTLDLTIQEIGTLTNQVI